MGARGAGADVHKKQRKEEKEARARSTRISILENEGRARVRGAYICSAHGWEAQTQGNAQRGVQDTLSDLERCRSRALGYPQGRGACHAQMSAE